MCNSKTLGVNDQLIDRLEYDCFFTLEDIIASEFCAF